MILGNFKEDSLLNKRPITTSLQSLGFTQIVSEPAHIRVPVLIIFISEITKADSQILICYLIAFIFLPMIQLFYTFKIGWRLFYLKKLFLVLNTDKLTNCFFCFFIVSTNKLKTNFILFFTEIMDFFSTKKEAESKVKKYFLFSLLLL